MKTNFKFITKTAVFIFILSTIFTSCAKNDTHLDNKNDKVVVATYYFPATLEPSKDWDSWYVVEFGVGETLTKYSKTGEVLPWLATSWKINEHNNKIWEIKLRDDVNFSNNVPMTANKVKEYIESLYDMENPIN